MKNLNEINCIELTALEARQSEGGGDKVKTSFWQDIAFIGRAIVNGFVA